MFAEALFERMDARGFREATLRLTDTAAVIPERLELTVGYGRGERSSADQHRPALLVINVCWSPSG